MRQWTVDAFAAYPFRGNPACVVEPFDRWPDERWMQSLAQENNQAETAFLLRTKEAGRFGLRWFTPTVEVPLCGHATLASAHTLISEIGVDADSVAFDTLSGQLSVARRGGVYEMDFPKDEPRRIEPPSRLAEALGVQPTECWIGKSLIAVLENEAAVRGVTPDLAAIHQIGTDDPSGRGNLVVTALADSGRDYAVVSRYFAPGSGIAEDPATGSIHCTLAPLFAKKLRRDEIRFHQAFPGRGGDLSVRVAGERVLISGQAHTIIESRLRLTPPDARGEADEP